MTLKTHVYNLHFAFRPTCLRKDQEIWRIERWTTNDKDEEIWAEKTHSFYSAVAMLLKLKYWDKSVYILYLRAPAGHVIQIHSFQSKHGSLECRQACLTFSLPRHMALRAPPAATVSTAQYQKAFIVSQTTTTNQTCTTKLNKRTTKACLKYYKIQ